MTRATFVLLCVAWWIGMPAAGASKPGELPDAATILDRYVQVTGGAAAYAKYGFVTIHSTIRQDDGPIFYTTIFHSRDGRTQTEIDANAASRESGLSNGIAWEFSEGKGARILSGKIAERELAKDRGLGDDDWRQRFPTAVAAGEQAINGKSCYRVKLTRADGSTIERFYDEQNGLLMRELSTEFDEAGIEQPVTTDFEQYERSLGFLHAAVIRLKTAAHSFTIQVNSLQYTAGPPPDAFEIPHEVVKAAAAQRNSGTLPNPVDVIDRFIEVTGGKDAYQSIKTQMSKAEISLKDQNLTFPLAVYAAQDKTYAYFELPTMGKFESGSDGHIAWERSVVLGPRLKPQSAVGGLLGPDADEVLKWTDASLGLEPVSKQEVNGSPCYEVSIGRGQEPGLRSTACFDVKTGYLVRTTLLARDQAGVTTQEETLFSDYRSHERFKTAHHIETKVAGKLVTIDLKEVAFNDPMPDGIFDLPAEVRALAKRREEQEKAKSVLDERPTLRRKRP